MVFDINSRSVVKLTTQTQVSLVAGGFDPQTSYTADVLWPLFNLGAYDISADGCDSKGKCDRLADLSTNLGPIIANYYDCGPDGDPDHVNIVIFVDYLNLHPFPGFVGVSSPDLLNSEFMLSKSRQAPWVKVTLQMTTDTYNMLLGQGVLHLDFSGPQKAENFSVNFGLGSTLYQCSLFEGGPVIGKGSLQK